MAVQFPSIITSSYSPGMFPNYHPTTLPTSTIIDALPQAVQSPVQATSSNGITATSPFHQLVQTYDRDQRQLSESIANAQNPSPLPIHTMSTTPLSSATITSFPTIAPVNPAVLTSFPTVLNPMSHQQAPPQMKPSYPANPIEAELVGIVTSVKSKKPLRCTIHCPGSGLTFQGYYPEFLFLNQGDTISGYGVVHGDQFAMSCKPFVELPMDKESVITGFIMALKIGYGPAMRIYNHLQKIATNGNVIALLTDNAQRYREHDPEVLDHLVTNYHGDILEFRGNLDLLLKWWYKWRNQRRLYLLGLTNTIIDETGLDCETLYQQLLTNPYVVAAVPLETCHSICRQLKREIKPNEVRNGNILRAIYRRQKQQGWTCTPSLSLSKEFPELTPAIYQELQADYGVVLDLKYNVIYLTEAHLNETWLVDYFTKLVKEDPINYHSPMDTPIPTTDGSGTITRKSAQYKRDNLSLDQQHAIQGALDHKVCIITGAAGTGKTTCLDEVIRNLDLQGERYVVCSFTGKAVARIRQVTKTRDPCTIHMAINNSPIKAALHNNNNNKTGLPSVDNPTVVLTDESPRVILMDEAFLTCGSLMVRLIKAYPMVERWIFFGDKHQLKPIEYLSVIENVLDAEVVPTYNLRTNFRVKTESGQTDGIIQNSTAIINHDPDYPFQFVTSHSNFQILEGRLQRVIDLLKLFRSRGIPEEDIVIISPFKDVLPEINSAFKEIYDSGGQYVGDSRGNQWRMGDRVMLTKNDYEIGVFNGEQGKVIDVQNNSIVVDFGDSGSHSFLLEPTGTSYDTYKYQSAEKGKYRSTDAEKEDEDPYDERTVLRLKHSYALTVYGIQGDERKYVIYYIPYFTGSNFLNCNLHYTAITRTQVACFCVVPSQLEFERTVTIKPNQRPARLTARLQDQLPNMKPFEIKFDWEVDDRDDDIPDEAYDD